MVRAWRQSLLFLLLLSLSALALAAPQNVRDNFGSNAYNNNNGSVNWVNDWQDSQDSNATAGLLQVTGGELRLEGVNGTDPFLTRTVDLSAAVGTVTFTYDYRTSNNLEASDTFSVAVATSAAGPFTTLQTYTDDSSASESFDITAFASATTTIRIQVDANLIGGTEFTFFDDVNIAYDDGSLSSGTCDATGVTETSYWAMDSATTDGTGGNNQQGGSVGFNTSDFLVGSAAADFNGTSHGIQYSNGTFMNQSVANISTSFFIKPDALSGTQVLFDEGGGTNGISIRLNGSNLQAAVREGGAGSQQTITTPFPSDGEWHHVAVVYANGLYTLYLDGVERGSVATGFGALAGHGDTSGYGARIGGSNAFGSGVDRYAGLMDDIYYFYAALTEAQIRSMSDCAGTTLNAPTINKSFNAATIAAGANSTLRFTLANTNDVALTGVDFTDNMPAQITLANTTVAGTCAGVSISAGTIAGGSTIDVTAGTIPANSSCTIDFTVTSNTVGAFNNTSGVMGTVEAPDSSASNTATLTVTGGGSSAGITKSFSPAAILANETSTLSFELSNANGFDLTGVSFTDDMPIAIWLDDLSVGGTCSNFSLTSSLGSSFFSLSGGVVPANSSCTVELEVRSHVIGTHSNTSSGVSSNEVALGATSNTAQLTVSPNSLSAACTPGDLGGGSINYSDNDELYSLNLATGKIESLTTAPVAFVASGIINSVAVDPRNYIIYYTDNTGSTANTAIYGYDMLADNHFTVEADVTTFGLTLGARGMGSGGGSFYGGSYYFATEDRNPGSEEVLFRAQMSDDGRSVLYAEEIGVFPAGTEFGDIVVTGEEVLIFDAGNDTYRNFDLATFTQQFTAGPNAFYSQGGAQRDGDTIYTVSNVIQEIEISDGSLVGSSIALTTDGTTPAGSAADSGGCVPTTSRIGDLVWNDSNLDGIKDNDEIGIAGVTLDLYYDLNSDGILNAADDITGDSLLTVADRIQTTTTASDGSYFFNNLVPDDYVVDVTDTANILGGASPTNGVTDPRPATNVKTNEERNGIDFGYSSFIVIQGGNVFNDNGSGGGIAHDGIKQAGEAGFEGVSVRVLDPGNSNALITSTLTDPNGAYTLFIPNAFAGSPVDIVVDTLSGHLSVSENVSTTGATNADTRDDKITFTPVAGSVINDVNFGDVPQNIFVPDNTGSAQPGQVVFYPHRYTSGSSGTVSFSSVGLDTPTGLAWNHVIYRDSDCSGDLNGSEATGAFSGSLAVLAGEEVCLINQVIAPTSAPFNSQYLVTITADFTYTGETPDGLTAQHVVNDLTTLAVVGLTLDKTVQNIGVDDLSPAGAVGTSNAALPNERLRYSITFTNNGNSDVNTLVIRDTVPPYTTLDVPISCPASLPNNLSACSVDVPAAIDNVAGYQGAIEWSFTGGLVAGESGVLQFDVRVD